MSGGHFAPAAGAGAPDPRRKGMALRGFACQNVAIGAAFGSFGVAVLPLQAHYGIGRGMVTLALGLAVAMLGLASPLVATLMARFGLRKTMVTGIVLATLGYVMLAFAPNFEIVLLAYALPVGLGITMFGPFPSSILAGRWFAHNPGPAIGFVNMPLLVALVPLATVPLIRDHGLSGLFLALAAMHVLLLPLALGIDEAPGTQAGGGGAQPQVPASAILSRPLFWMIATGAGVLHAAGIIGSSHLVAFAVERGVPDGQAAILASTMGGASVIGAFGAGLLCARIGGALTLAVLALAMGAGWGLLLLVHDLPSMVAMTLLLGAGGAGVFPAINVLAGEKFGAAAVARTVGLFGLATLPFNFGLPPLAGVLHDAARSYDPVVMAIVIACAVVMAIYVVMARLPARTRAALPA